MPNSRYALACDSDGNTLWRVKGARDHDFHFELVSPDGGHWGMDLWAMWDSGSAEIMDVTLSHTRLGHAQSTFPDAWIVWVLQELFSVHPLDVQYLPDKMLIPASLAVDSWADIEQHLNEAGTVELQHRILADSSDWEARKELCRIVEEALEGMGLKAESRSAGAIAILREWILKGPRYLELSVWRRKEEGNADSHLAYTIYDKDAPEGQQNIHGTSLVDVLKKRGRFITRSDRASWLEEHMVDPEWLFDPEVLEVYDLLQARYPVVEVWRVFDLWAQEHNLQSES